MDEQSYVRIPIDEYFELRQKAEMNMQFATQMGSYETRLMELHNLMNNLEYEVKCLKEHREFRKC